MGPGRPPAWTRPSSASSAPRLPRGAGRPSARAPHGPTMPAVPPRGCDPRLRHWRRGRRLEPAVSPRERDPRPRPPRRGRQERARPVTLVAHSPAQPTTPRTCPRRHSRRADAYGRACGRGQTTGSYCVHGLLRPEPPRVRPRAQGRLRPEKARVRPCGLLRPGPARERVRPRAHGLLRPERTRVRPRVRPRADDRLVLRPRPAPAGTSPRTAAQFSWRAPQPGRRPART